MNSRKILLHYLKTNNNLNIHEDIYESYINQERIASEDILSPNLFIKGYLAYICKHLKNLEKSINPEISPRDLITVLQDYSKYRNIIEVLEEIPYFPYRSRLNGNAKESKYLRQLLIILTRNYQMRLNRTFLLVNRTNSDYIEKFVRFIIASLKNNTDTELTYLYLSTISNFCLGNETTETRKERIRYEEIKDIENEEWNEEKWSDPLVYDTMFHPICKDFSTFGDLKELFLTLTLNYKGVFSENTRHILKTTQTHTFKRVYEQISLISNRREHEYIRQVFESILRYLENNNSVDVEGVWVANISLENTAESDRTRQRSLTRKRSKSFSNWTITLGFSEEVEEMENNDLLEFSELEPFYIPIYYRKHIFEEDF